MSNSIQNSNSMINEHNQYIIYEFSSNGVFFNVVLSFDTFLKCFNFNEIDEVEQIIRQKLLGLYIEIVLQSYFEYKLLLLNITQVENIELDEYLVYTLNPSKLSFFGAISKNIIKILIKSNNEVLTKYIALRLNSQDFICKHNLTIHPNKKIIKNPLIELSLVAMEEKISLKELQTIDVGCVVFFDSLEQLQGLYSNVFIKVGNSKISVQLQSNNTAIILK